MGLGKGAGETPNVVECSICIDAVRENAGRSIAKLKCGHQFHLDCIGSAFNAKGVMQCPNCRKVEDGEWLYASGSASMPEYITLEEFINNDTMPLMEHSEPPIQPFPRHRHSSDDQASFEEREFSPAAPYRDSLGHHSINTELPAGTSAVDTFPYMAYMQPILPSYFSSFPVPFTNDAAHEYYRHFSPCYQTSYATNAPQFYSPVHSATLAPIFMDTGMRGLDSDARLMAGSRASFSDLPHSRPWVPVDESYPHYSRYLQDNRLSGMLQSGSFRDTGVAQTLQEQTSYFLIQQPVSSQEGAVNAENASRDTFSTLGVEIFASPLLSADNEDILPGHLPQSVGSNAAHYLQTSSPRGLERRSTVIELI